MNRMLIAATAAFFAATAAFSQSDSAADIAGEAAEQIDTLAQSDSADTGETEEDFSTETPISLARKVIVMRPVQSFGAEEYENKWLLRLCEDYFYFRFGAIPGIEAVDIDLLGGLLPGFADLKKPLSLEAYMKAAKNLESPYVLYTECSYTPLTDGGQITVGKELNITLQLLAAEDSSEIVTVARRAGLGTLSETLDRFVHEMLDSLKVSEELRNAEFSQKPVLSRRARSLKQLGEAIAAAPSVEKDDWPKFMKKFDKLVIRNPDMPLSYYSGAMFCAERKEYKTAARLSHDLVNEYRSRYPQAYVLAARNYRLAEDCDNAQKIAMDANDIIGIHNALVAEVESCQ